MWIFSLSDNTSRYRGLFIVTPQGKNRVQQHHFAKSHLNLSELESVSSLKLYNSHRNASLED